MEAGPSELCPRERIGSWSVSSQTQAVEAQSVLAPRSPDDTELEEALLAPGGAATYVPLLAAEDVSEALGATVATPAPTIGYRYRGVRRRRRSPR